MPPSNRSRRNRETVSNTSPPAQPEVPLNAAPRAQQQEPIQTDASSKPTAPPAQPEVQLNAAPPAPQQEQQSAEALSKPIAPPEAPLNAAPTAAPPALQQEPIPLVASAPPLDDYQQQDQQPQYQDQQPQYQQQQQQDQQQQDQQQQDQQQQQEDQLPPTDCNVFPSLFGAADEACYIEQPLPEVQELIRQVLYEQASQLSSRAIIDVLIATGNEALVKAILAKSLTPQQAELLKQVAKDPQVEAAMKEVKDRLLQGVNASIENVQETVLPKVQDSMSKVVQGTFDAIKDEIDDIPGVGAVVGVIDAATTGIEALEDATQITNEFQQAIKPAQEAMGEVGKLTGALGDAATRAQNAASDAASGLETQASNTVADMSEKASSTVTNAASEASNTVADVSNAAANTVSNTAPNTVPNTDEKKNQGGGSKTRRRIHKLSRRIERTLRRIQKKYGLQDKNSFLRRTLKRR